MEKQTKTTYTLFGLTIISIIVHNLIYGLFELEEPVFFLLTFFFLFGFIVSVLYNAFIYIKRREPQDLWKLGFLGLFGLIGLIPGFDCGFFGFLGFFGFFGAKKWK